MGTAAVDMEHKPCGCVWEWETTLNTATLGRSWYTRKLMQIRKVHAAPVNRLLPEAVEGIAKR